MEDGASSVGKSTEKQAKNDRIRENQRRSRQRRKEYLQDLEKRDLKAKREGIQANQEMQAAARRVLDQNTLYREENMKLRHLLATMGMPESQIEERLKTTTTDGSSRRGSTQLTSVTTLSIGPSLAQQAGQLNTLLGETSQQFAMAKAEARNHYDDDEDDDEDEGDLQDLRTPVNARHDINRKRLSLAVNPGRRVRAEPPSPIRPPDSTLLSQPPPGGPRSISSSTTTTPTHESQASSLFPPGSGIIDPRGPPPLSRQLAVPAQTEIFGVPPQLSPQQMYTYSMAPPQPPQPVWPRQQDYPPISMPAYSPTTTVGMLGSGAMVSAGGSSFQQHSQHSQQQQQQQQPPPPLPPPVLGGQHSQQQRLDDGRRQQQGRYGNVLPDPNPRPHHDQSDRWQ